MATVAPLKCVHISAKRKFSRPWLTQGFETSNRKVKQLYKETLKLNCSTESLNKYKQHQNLLNRIKHKTKTLFYNTKCEEYRNNTKKLWQVNNQTIGKQKHGGSIIPYISIEGIKIYDPKKISNAFGSFYAKLGSDLAKKIQSERTSKDEYINMIPRNLNSLALRQTTEKEIRTLISQLPNKSSSGHNQISNKLLKGIVDAISTDVCI